MHIVRLLALLGAFFLSTPSFANTEVACGQALNQCMRNCRSTAATPQQNVQCVHGCQHAQIQCKAAGSSPPQPAMMPPAAAQPHRTASASFADAPPRPDAKLPAGATLEQCKVGARDCMAGCKDPGAGGRLSKDCAQQCSNAHARCMQAGRSGN